MTEVNIEYVDKLYPVFTKEKRIKIIVGGRGSTKSTGIADLVDVRVSNGELWCCAREHQNSIEESVHRTLLDEISRVGL
jgi:phage terminase large subunit